MNEQISCGIAQDLMPLVIDDACGEDSRRAVENHIAGCGECAKVYEAMKAEMPKPAADETNYVCTGSAQTYGVASTADAPRVSSHGFWKMTPATRRALMSSGFPPSSVGTPSMSSV